MGPAYFARRLAARLSVASQAVDGPADVEDRDQQENCQGHHQGELEQALTALAFARSLERAHQCDTVMSLLQPGAAPDWMLCCPTL